MLDRTPTIAEVVKVLGSYNGRDKAMRSICFGLLLVSAEGGAEWARGVQLLAAQISKARLVARQLSHVPLLYGTANLWHVWRRAPDPVDAGLSLASMLGYSFYSFFELGCWLSEARLVRLSRRNWYTYALCAWVAALGAAIAQALRRIHVLEAREDAKAAPDARRLEQRALERLGLAGNAADLVAGVALLPRGVLWGQRLGRRPTALCFLAASLIGLYRCF